MSFWWIQCQSPSKVVSWTGSAMWQIVVLRNHAEQSQSHTIRKGASIAPDICFTQAFLVGPNLCYSRAARAPGPTPSRVDHYTPYSAVIVWFPSTHTKLTPKSLFLSAPKISNRNRNRSRNDCPSGPSQGSNRKEIPQKERAFHFEFAEPHRNC